MKQSESIAKLAAALLLVQEHIEPITKDSENAHFKNSYASLDHIMETIRPLLTGHGLAVVQGGAGPVSDVNGAICGVSVETVLVHASGEYLSSIIVLPLDKPSAQAVGSAITYGRRYGVSALLALSTEEDDDGNRATASQMNAGDRQTGNAPSKPLTNGASAAIAKAANGDGEPCPKCGGPCYDNRAENDKRAAEGKKLRPDWACKNAPKERGGPGCTGVIWRPDA